MTDLPAISSGGKKTRTIVAGTLLAGLLILRLLILGLLGWFTDWGWLSPVYEIGTYFLTACLIWLERDRLADFHIDTLALAVIIFFKPFQTVYLTVRGMAALPLAFPSAGAIGVWIVAAGLLLALWLSRPRPAGISGRSILWFGIGLLVGLMMAVVTGWLMSHQMPKGTLLPGMNVWSYLLPAAKDVPYQLGYAAVSEEPLFRGFLWGYLRKAGWKNIWILLFQAGLFMIGHIYYVIEAPISFWLIVPLGALVLGALAWRSRTICSSLAAHAVVNGFGYTIACLFSSVR
jgi:hypothetical protein